MTRTIIDTDEHKGVGPAGSMYGHRAVTGIAPGPSEGWELLICMDCGYTTRFYQQLAHEECSRDDNAINLTWREKLDREGHPEVFNEP